jgi:hypothetical protein
MNMSYQKVLMIFSAAGLALGFSGSAFPWGSTLLRAPGSLVICADTDPMKGQIGANADTATVEQHYVGITCTSIDDTQTPWVTIGKAPFNFDSTISNVGVTKIDAAGTCTTTYTGVCPQATASTTLKQVSGMGLCNGMLCDFESYDPTATAKNKNEVQAICDALYPQTIELPKDVMVTYSETKDGACSNDSGQIDQGTLYARYCMPELGGTCITKVKGTYIVKAASQDATPVIEANWQFSDPLNLNAGDNGTSKGDFYGSANFDVTKILGAVPFNSTTAPKVEGSVAPTSVNITDLDNDGFPDARFFYPSTSVVAAIIDEVQSDGSVTLFVTASTTLGTAILGVDTIQTNGH